MEKLELKHLAPYLPYGLMGNDHNGGRIEITIIMLSHHFSGRIGITPILRPLSEITQDLNFVAGSYFNALYLMNKGFNNSPWDIIVEAINKKEYQQLPQWVFDQLCEWHFDVFLLIEKGLAISIRDIKK